MLVAAPLLALLLATAPSADGEPSLSEWDEGPVRYLLTRREHKEFRALKDDSARSEFIRMFWRRRDPILETGENEARIAFWRRVVEANRLFQETSTLGWKSDRGKIYILIGPPTDIQEDINYDVRDPHTTGRGLIRWLYEGTLSIASLGGTFVVPFVRGNDGDYHLSADPRFANPAFNALNAYDSIAPPQLARIQSSFDYGAADLGTALDQGLIQAPPWQEKDFIDRVTSEAYLGAIPMEVGFDFLKAADGTTFALINVGVPLSGFSPIKGGAPSNPNVSVVARLSPVDGGDPIDAGESAFNPSPLNSQARGDDPLVYQARVPLRPGRYSLYVGLFERVRLQAANLRSTVEIPDLSGPLSLSSIALGRSIRPVPEGSGGYNRPFRVSDFEFIPAVGGLFRSGQNVAALWQIYTEGSAGPGSDLQVTSRFYLSSDGEEKPVGKPRVIENAEAVQGFSVQLEGWPSGAYRFEVSVRDRQGRTAVRSASFRIQ